MILQVVQHIFCEMVIGERKIVKSDMFFGVNNIRTNVQNDSSEFEGYFIKWCQRNPLLTKRYITLIGMVKENYALCLHT